jgi:hypothetical protein
LYYLAVAIDFKRKIVMRYATVWTTVLLFVVIDDLPVEYVITYFLAQFETTLRTGNTNSYKWGFVKKC